MTTEVSKFSKEPRPVYYKELDVLGFDRYWNYPKDEHAPLLWAEANNYIYKGRTVARTKGGSLYTAPELIPLEDPEPDGKSLQFVDVDRTYTEDFFVEVSEEIHQLFIDFKHQEDAFLRQVSRYHAYHSLDDPNFPVEQCVFFQKPALVDAVEQRHSAMSIYEAILSLPPKQAKRCYDHYYQGFKISDIAQKEGVTAGSISECIKSALSALRERCNFFNFYD